MAHVPYCERPKGNKPDTRDCGPEWSKGHRCIMVRERVADAWLTRAELDTLKLWFALRAESLQASGALDVAQVFGIEVTPNVLGGLQALDAERLQIQKERREAKEEADRRKAEAARNMRGRR